MRLGASRRRRRPRSVRHRRVTALVVVALLALTVPAGVSYGRALTYPGDASFSVRSVEWVREHGGAPLVDAVENWYYSRQAPSATGAPQDTLTPARATQRAARAQRTPHQPPRVRLLPGVSPLHGEGQWQPVGADGILQATWLRPDPRHLPVVATAVLLPAAQLALHLSPGTREPVVGATPVSGTRVPPAALSRLVATFNSGFKMRDSHGGFEIAGRTYVPLRAGRASLVLTRGGGWRIGVWGSDVGPGPDVAAVRQNLDLVVANGRPVPGVASNANGRWGTAHTQFQYTTRSGLGLTAAGDLVYVSGRSMTLGVLADAMSRLGVVTGMQLDIHPQMVTFNVVSARSGGSVTMAKLVPSMVPGARRYLTSDQRDFLYLTRR